MSTVIVQYYNLLIRQTSSTSMVVIGEDTTVTTFGTNVAETGLDSGELSAYTTNLAAIETLTVTHTGLTQLPPGTRFTGLLSLDISGCTNIVSIPATYNDAMTTLRASSTKISSIPAVYDSLTTLDVANCKRISSVSIATLTTLTISYSTVTEVVSPTGLVRLIALSSKLTSIPAATALRVVVWSGVSGSTLTISTSNTGLLSVITTGATSLITTSYGVVSNIVL